MSEDCLPCGKKIDPTFLELLKKRKKEAEEQKEQAVPSPSINKGVSIEYKEDGTVDVHTKAGANNYKVISHEGNHLVVKFEEGRPIPAHLSNVNFRDNV